MQACGITNRDTHLRKLCSRNATWRAWSSSGHWSKNLGKQKPAIATESLSWCGEYDKKKQRVQEKKIKYSKSSKSFRNPKQKRKQIIVNHKKITFFFSFFFLAYRKTYFDVYGARRGRILLLFSLWLNSEETARESPSALGVSYVHLTLKCSQAVRCSLSVQQKNPRPSSQIGYLFLQQSDYGESAPTGFMQPLP